MPLPRRPLFRPVPADASARHPRRGRAHAHASEGDNAVQCDLYPYQLMEQALNLAGQQTQAWRDARAWQAQRQRPLRWVLGVSLLVSGLGVWWLA